MQELGLIIDPRLPPVALALAGFVGLALVLLAMRAGARGRWWRLAFFLLLGFLALDPRLVRQHKTALEDIALVAIDRSPSNRIVDRADAATAALEEIRARAAEEGVELRLVETARRAGRTELLGPLAAALAETPRDRLSAVIAISDGLVDDRGHEAAIQAASVPFHALITGDSAMPDRRIRILRAPEYGIVDRPLSLEILIEEQNMTTTGPVRLSINRPGQNPEARMVSVGRPVEVSVTPESRGEMLVEVSVAAGEDETFLENNRALFSINAVRDRLRVLLISGEPHPGERVWRDTLKSDPAVDLVHFTILRLPTSQDATPTSQLSLIPFPTERLFAEQLDDFDLVIFDRYSLRGVLEARYFDNLRAYVEGGGAILAANGPEYAGDFSIFRTSLAPVLPVAPTARVLSRPYKPRLTADGRRHPVTSGLDSAMAGRWYRMVEGQALAGDVLMTGAGGAPLLVLSRVGRGRVAALMSDHIWLWARDIEGGGPYQELLRRSVHWLMKEPDLEEEALRAQSEGDEIAIERRSLKAEASAVTVIDPNGEQSTVRLEPDGDGMARARIPAPVDGFYRLSDGESEAVTAVGSTGGHELSQILPDDSALRPLAEATGGSVHWLKDGMPEIRRPSARAAAAGRDWIGLPRREAARTDSVAESPLMPGWLWLVLLLPLLALGWFRESR